LPDDSANDPSQAADHRPLGWPPVDPPLGAADDPANVSPDITADVSANLPAGPGSGSALI
jgi:hypothetical protein